MSEDMTSRWCTNDVVIGFVVQCPGETFVGPEVEFDEAGEPTTKWYIEASCNQADASNCGWTHRLTEFDDYPREWFLTSGDMTALHQEHMASVLTGGA